MPHFSESGHDVVLCQGCGSLIDTGKTETNWRPDITGSKCAGLVCQPCVDKHDALPITLYEHCRRESGGLEGQALQNYINRHYGHG